MNGFSDCRQCRVVAPASRRRDLTFPIGCIDETRQMLYFCGQHKISAGVEAIPIQKIKEAWERMVKSDVKYRFSIDMASLILE